MRSTVAVPLTVGGGVRERRDVSELLHAGADKVSINSAAVALIFRFILSGLVKSLSRN